MTAETCGTKFISTDETGQDVPLTCTKPTSRHVVHRDASGTRFVRVSKKGAFVIEAPAES